jgi:hypothetical protein
MQKPQASPLGILGLDKNMGKTTVGSWGGSMLFLGLAFGVTKQCLCEPTMPKQLKEMKEFLNMTARKDAKCTCRTWAFVGL